MKMFYLLSFICLLTLQCSIMTGLGGQIPESQFGNIGGNITFESDEWYDEMIACLKSAPCEIIFEDISKVHPYDTFEELQQFIDNTLTYLYNAYQLYCKYKDSSYCKDARKKISKLVTGVYSENNPYYYPHLKAQSCNKLLTIKEIN